MANLPIMELNLEEGMPTCEEAMSLLKDTIARRKKDKAAKCIVIIHGYGSSGVGGKIRTSVRKWLNAQCEKHLVKSVVNGEDFDVTNPKAREIKSKYQGLDSLTRGWNHGITIVEL